MARNRTPSRAARQFVKALAAPAPGSGSMPPMFTGSVTAVNLANGTISVTLPGDTTATSGVSVVGSHMPIVGETVVLAQQGPHIFAHGQVAKGAVGLVGPGQKTNIVSGGNDRSGTSHFDYSTSKLVSISGGQWSFTDSTSGVFWNGCGWFSVTPAGDVNSLGFLTIISSACSIGSGDLTLGGFAQNYNGTNIGSGNILINVRAIGW
jgi:hypothetical protein